MPLLSLPNEVLNLIIRESVPASFEGLVLSCKLLCDLGKPYINDQKFLRQFRNFSYRKHAIGTNGRPIKAGWQLLYNIAEEPRIAGSIEMADLREPAISDSGAGTSAEKQLWGGQKVRDGILGLLRKDPAAWAGTMLDEKVMMNLLFDDDEVDKGTAEMFLLTLLPNVEVLVARYTWMNNWMDWQDTREAALVPMANTLYRRASSRPRQTSALSRLREFAPLTTAGSRNQVCALNSFQPLLALPSLEIAKLATCVWKDSELNLDAEGIQKLDFETYPGLRQLEVSCSSLRPAKLLEILTRTPRLEILTLDYERDDNSAKKIGWKLGEIIESLGQAAGRHLKALHIRTPDWPERIGSQPKHFRSFEVLEELEIDLNILHPQTIGGMLYNPELTEQELDDSTTVMPPFAPLTEILPPSLRRLRIQVRMTSPHRFDSEWFPGMLRSLFAGFQDRFASVLPKLEVVELQQSEGPRVLKGFERQTEDLRAAVREIAEENSQVRIVTQSVFQNMSLERR